MYKVLTKEKLSTFFACVDNYKFKTIFMLAYGSGLRIGEITNLRVEDIDSKTELLQIAIMWETFRKKAAMVKKVTLK